MHEPTRIIIIIITRIVLVVHVQNIRIHILIHRTTVITVGHDQSISMLTLAGTLKRNDTYYSVCDFLNFFLCRKKNH